jgi:hypothetical protein
MGFRGLPVELASHRPIREPVVVNVHVVMRRMVPEVPAQRTSYSLATFGEVERIGDPPWCVELNYDRASHATTPLVDVGSGGPPYVLNEERVAHLCPNRR